MEIFETWNSTLCLFMGRSLHMFVWTCWHMVLVWWNCWCFHLAILALLKDSLSVNNILLFEPAVWSQRMKLEVIFCPFQICSLFSWICLFAIFRAFALISLVACTSTEFMEPAPLAPPSGGQRQRNEQGKNLFPLVIFIAALSGSSVDDGFDILASFWAESVRKIKPQDFQQERDAWATFFASAARRAKKGRTALLKASANWSFG